MFTREDLINDPKIYQSHRRELTTTEINNTATLQTIMNEYGADGWQYISNILSIEHTIFAMGDHPVAYGFDRMSNHQTDSEEYFNQKGKESWKYVGNSFRVNLFMK